MERGNPPPKKTPSNVFSSLTCEVVVLLAVAVGERHQFPEQQGVLEHPLHRFNQVGLQGGGVLLGGVPGIQEFLEGLIGLGWKTSAQASGLLLLPNHRGCPNRPPDEGGGGGGLHPEAAFW